MKAPFWASLMRLSMYGGPRPDRVRPFLWMLRSRGDAGKLKWNRSYRRLLSARIKPRSVSLEQDTQTDDLIGIKTAVMQDNEVT